MSFRVGQKVVCVDAAPVIAGDMSGLREGIVYTIRWIGIYSDHNHQPPQLGVRLEEIDRRVWPDISEVPYLARRFRPVVNRSTDAGMAILRQILREHQQPIREPAARVTAQMDHAPAPPS